MFRKFDKDKSYLLSATELKRMIKVYQGKELADLHVQQLEAYIRTTVGRSELKRQEFYDLVDRLKK